MDEKRTEGLVRKGEKMEDRGRERKREEERLLQMDGRELLKGRQSEIEGNR